MLEAELQLPFSDGDTLLFEPDLKMEVDGLHMAEAVVTQQSQGRILVIKENYAALSARVEPGMCVGTATVVVPEELVDVGSAVPKAHPHQQNGEIQVQDSSQCSQVQERRESNPERSERLCSLLVPERGGLTEGQS